MWQMKNNYKIYTNRAFAEICKMYGSKAEFARQINVDVSVLGASLKGKPVQASFVANALRRFGTPFDSLFEVR